MVELIDRCRVLAEQERIVFCLVNNGSTDGTSKILSQLEPIEGIKLLTISENEGYGNGICAGLAELQTDYLGWTHADLQTDPNDLLKALQTIQQKPEIDFIKGVRIGRSNSDKFFTFGMTLFVLIARRRFLLDINGQPTIMRRKLFHQWERIPKDFSIDLSAFLHAKKYGANISRFKVLFANRLYGKSSWNTGFKSRLKLASRTIKFTLSGKKV